MRSLIRGVFAAAVALTVSTTMVVAGPLMDRIKAGDPIRIGFANIPIYGYPGPDGQPKGFVNEIAIAILHSMGYKNITSTVTDWGGLIPGLQANRYDVITGGLYILGSRCKHIAFSNPIGKTGDAFLVPAGNPKHIETYKDILAQHLTLVTGSGYNTIEAAKKEGLTDAMIMQVPGPSEILAAVKAGRADVGGLTYFEAKSMADADPAVDVTDPSALPEWSQNWVGIGFRKSDEDFLKKFNEALAKYVGTEKMLQSVAQYGYTKSNLPGDKTAKWTCANR